MQQRITRALDSLKPSFVEVHDESHLHRGGGQSHFKLVVVSDSFATISAVQRHRKVYAALNTLMPQLHALALHTYTSDEWAKLSVAPQSPRCLGGSKVSAQ